MSGKETGKAREILRRRGDRSSKLQKAIDRGSARSNQGGTTEHPVKDAASSMQGRPVKPIRITVDLNAAQHRFLREFTLDTGTRGTEVLRGLLAELEENTELRSRLMQRIKR
jgi:hypothetical protein